MSADDEVASEPVIDCVLVVDDNAENRALAKATLEDEDIRVVLAASGEAGIAAFAEHAPACILLDIRMPGLDGIDTCERIRAMPGGDRVAIVFVTAQRDVDTFDRAAAVKGDDFITKPFRPAELVVRLHTAVRLRRMTAERGDLSRLLKQQRDELQRLQLHKEQLSAFVVHDLKNPVNAIELHAQRVLRNAAADARSRDAASKIHDEARGLMRMITNLLDITRADEGQLAPARERLDVGSLVADAVTELQSLAAAAKVELATRVHDEHIVGDRGLLHRVLVNLVENAIRHAPEDTVIHVMAQSSAGATELRVIDRGAGVPEERRADIFDRFVTTGQSTNRGLGLAFCKVAVEAHGGAITVEDAAPGAVFCVRIADAP